MNYAGIIARLASTVEDIRALDSDEAMEGYRDGRADDPAPGPNRSPAYVQGWWAGMGDGHHRGHFPIDSAIAKAGLIILREMKFPIAKGD